MPVRRGDLDEARLQRGAVVAGLDEPAGRDDHPAAAERGGLLDEIDGSLGVHERQHGIDRPTDRR